MNHDAPNATLGDRILAQLEVVGRSGMSARVLEATLDEPKRAIREALADLRQQGKICTVSGDRSAKWMLAVHAGTDRRKRLQRAHGPDWVPPLSYFPEELRPVLTRVRAMMIGGKRAQPWA